MPIDLGDSVTRSVAITNTSGVAADADSTPTYAITLPSGTAGISPAVQHGTAGDYYVVYPTTAAGLHQEVWTAVVGGVTIVIRRSFVVEETGSAFIDTDEALAHLRAQGLITTSPDLEQLRWLCQVASTAVEDDLGRAIARRSIVDTFDGGRFYVRLRTPPVLSLTTVVENGVTLTSTDYVLDTSLALLWRGTVTASRSWYPALQTVVVTYSAGMLVPPRVARKVALNLVERMWAQSQQAPHPAFDELSIPTVAPAASLTSVELAAYDRLRWEGIA